MIVSFTGAQSTGKTTLLNILKSKNKDINFIDEVTRRINREYDLPINESGSTLTQLMIIADHVANIFRKYDSDLVILDRCIIDGLVYSEWLYDNNNISISMIDLATEIYHSIYKESLITLHGWLRIVPENICEQYNIVNGHPGLITAYPQLKGKDPQVRAYKDNYGVIGSVVHKVTSEVDDGEVLTYTAIYRQNKDTLDDVFKKLAFTSFKSWQKFFSDIK